MFIEFEHDFKFAILSSAFKSLTSSHVALFNRLNGDKIEIPTLHIIGQNDQVVEHSRSESLANEYFNNPTIVLHPGGHTVPSQTSFRDKYLDFLSLVE